MPRSAWETALAGVRFSRRSGARGGQAPALRLVGPSPFTVGRGPVPRHATVEEMALVGVRFLRRSNDRGGQAPALRLMRPSPFHRRARACPSPRNDRGGQAPALRARKGFFSPCAVRDRASPNYSFLKILLISGEFCSLRWQRKITYPCEKSHYHPHANHYVFTED